MLQQQQQQNIQAQSQANAQAAQVASQAKQQEMQMQAQLEAQKIQLKGQVDVQVAQAMHQMSMQLEQLKAQMAGGTRSGEQMFREKLETMKDDRKDQRVKKQAVEQSKLISQRKGERAPLADVESDNQDIQNFLQSMI